MCRYKKVVSLWVLVSFVSVAIAGCGRGKVVRRAQDIVDEEIRAMEARAAEYYIGTEDVLDISVWGIADMTKEVIVRPDGKISFPLVGDIQAEGLTLTELDQSLTRALKLYIREPEVSIAVKKFGGRKVIVLGEVKNPGVYRFVRDIRLTEALGLAGGHTDKAVTKKILVMRGDLLKGPKVVSVNLKRIIKKGKVHENILIEPDDVVYVSRSFIANVNEFVLKMAPYVSMVSTAVSTREILRRRR